MIAIGMLPGVDMRRLSAAGGLDEKELVRTEAIIQSMTRQERQNPSIINASRKKKNCHGQRDKSTGREQAFEIL